MPITFINAPSQIFQRLKTATAEMHSQVEKHVPVFDPGFDLASYIRLLERFYGFWIPMEAKLLSVEGLRHPALAITTRMKSALLEADLRVLGRESAMVPLCAEVPGIETFAAGMGCLYVLEGSTLGGRIISRRIESHLGLRADSGAAFFNAYGNAVGERWSAFRTFVEEHVGVRDAEGSTAAAIDTFGKLDTWLGRFG